MPTRRRRRNDRADHDAVPTLVEQGADLRPLPWRRMAWVTWRQHRTALIGVFVFIGALALCLLIVGLQLHNAYAAAIACHPASSAACSASVANFNGIGNFLSNGVLFLVVPPLIGAFVGAPVLAREFEAGTFRYAWTQGFGPWRWTLAKLVGLGVVVAAASGALSAAGLVVLPAVFRLGQPVLVPYHVQSAQSRIVRAARVCVRRMDPGRFRHRRPGRRAHSQSRPCHRGHSGRVRGTRLRDGGWLRMHYLTPLVTKGLNVPGSARIVSQWGSRGGRVVFTGPPTYPIYQQYCPAQAGLGKGAAGRRGESPPVPGSARLHVLDQLPARQPVLGVPVDRRRLAARAVGPAHRCYRLAGPPSG